MSGSSWLSAYLYYAEPFEPLLKDFVRPFVNEVLTLRGVEQFFFIRYWHCGPHIRLRFKILSADCYQQLKKYLDKRYSEFVKNNPSFREESGWASKLKGDDQWRDNNAIHYVPYEPEIERYGGNKAILVAEEHFQQSSNIVLDILSQSNSWGYENALGSAIQLHLSFAYALSMKTKEAVPFFDYIYTSWFPRAIAGDWSNMGKSELEEQKEDTLNAFQKSFENQREALVPFCARFWDTLHNGQVAEELKLWIAHTKQTGDALVEIQRQDSLAIPTSFKVKEELEVSVEIQKRWCIYQSFVHMTNNRLGLLNRDEGFLGFLIRECFREITANIPLNDKSH